MTQSMLMLENACLDPGDITIFGGEYNVLQSEPPSRYMCVGVYVCLLSYAHYGLLKACRWSVRSEERRVGKECRL